MKSLPRVPARRLADKVDLAHPALHPFFASEADLQGAMSADDFLQHSASIPDDGRQQIEIGAPQEVATRDDLRPGARSDECLVEEVLRESVRAGVAFDEASSDPKTSIRPEVGIAVNSDVPAGGPTSGPDVQA